MFQIIVLILISSCSSLNQSQFEKRKDFSPGELILATELLTRIFDREMGPIRCVGDTEEASLLLRTIHPRLEIVQDDFEAILDDPLEIKKIIASCEKNCTCFYLDELFREHQVHLDDQTKKNLENKKNQKELNACLNYIKEVFCESDLYQQLNQEKGDFSFQE